MQKNMIETPDVNRRSFLKKSGVAAAGAVAVANMPFVLTSKAAAVESINAVIIGVGGRGGGAGGNFLEAAKAVGIPAKIVGAADIFPDQARRARDNFQTPVENCFGGFDAPQKALAIPGVNYAILASPPGFRALHFKACAEADKKVNVFMEKPVAVDGPTCRMMYETAEIATQKNLKVAAGTQRRHQAGYIETVKRLQDGAIGDIMFMRAYWVNGGPIWHRGEQGETEMEKQIRNWYHYIWLCGDHICEQHVHNLDVANWVMNDHPTKCWGSGGRGSLGNKSGHIWDHFAIEYEYANGVRLYSYCGQQKRSWSSVSETIHGTKGTSNPSGNFTVKGGERWRSTFKTLSSDPYVQEHIDLINAIVKDTPLNEAKQVTDSTLTAIMGREAAFSGAEISWDQMLNSKHSYMPEKLEWGPAPVLKVPEPGVYKLV